MNNEQEKLKEVIKKLAELINIYGSIEDIERNPYILGKWRMASTIKAILMAELDE